MKISRRAFLQYCGASTVVLAACDGGGGTDPDPTPSDPTPPGTGAKVIWMIASGCGGCTVSFLNRFADEAPQTAADVLMDVAVVGYQPMLMAAAGDQAVAAAEAFYAAGAGNYLLVVDGAIPTAFNGGAGTAWTDASGAEVTLQSAIQKYAANATAVLCIGTCAAYGGVSAAEPNPSGAKSVSAVIGQKTINIPGCPPHPDWIVAGLARALSDQSITLDSQGRPTDIFSTNVHYTCPRNQGPSTIFATTLGVDNQCLRNLGCAGPATTANCPSHAWNSGRNWCVEANGLCVGCTEPTFPRVGLDKPV